jgi:hypothetical protein
MARDCKIEFLIQNPPDDEHERCEKLVETLIDQLIPRIAETLDLNEDELVARLMVELAHVVGVTHTPDSALNMLAMLGDAIASGQQAVHEQADESEDHDGDESGGDDKDPSGDYDQQDWVHLCSSVRH